MLQKTFMHIQSIGAITEQRLWESGLRDWDSFSDDLSIPLSGKRKYLLQKGTEESKRHLADRNPSYFSKCLPANQSWRLFPEFRDSTAYLDIETTGLDRHFNEITTIALYDGQVLHESVLQNQSAEIDADLIDDQVQHVVNCWNQCFGLQEN